MTKERRSFVAQVLAVFFVGAASLAFAQPFENIYGPPDASDRGARRVSSVNVCPGGGFVAVGTTRPPVGIGSSDIYLVRTAPDGSPLWELSYDLGPGGNDRGQALAESGDGSGFVLGGTTNLGPASDDLVLLKVSCDGIPQWSFRYASSRPETLADLVEARTGDPALGTGPGDILVAGMAANPAGNRDALLLRVRRDGLLLWNQRYDVGSATEVFRGLTEASPSGGTTAGDVVGAGLSSFGGSMQGYALRVNGNNGLLTAANHVGAVYGGPDPEGFESVIELRLGAAAGSLVFVGNTYSTPTASDLYLVRTLPNPALWVAQRRIGAAATAALGEEAALDGKEMRFTLDFAPAGALALTGRVGRPGTTAADAFLLAANASSLVPLAGSGRLFGDHGLGREWGVSLSDHSSGLVVAGLSESNLENALPPDPSDLYLVGTNAAGRTGCAEPWNPPNITAYIPVQRVWPAAVPILTRVEVAVEAQKLDTLVEHCP